MNSLREAQIKTRALIAVKNGTLDLDNTVDELKGLEATEINNSGGDVQVMYVLGRAGAKFLEEIMTGHD